MTFAFPVVVPAAGSMLLLLCSLLKMLLLCLFGWRLCSHCHCHLHCCRSHWLLRYFHKCPPNKLNYLKWLYWLPKRGRVRRLVTAKNNPNRMNLKLSNDYQDKDPASKNVKWDMNNLLLFCIFLHFNFFLMIFLFLFIKWTLNLNAMCFLLNRIWNYWGFMEFCTFSVKNPYLNCLHILCLLF